MARGFRVSRWSADQSVPAAAPALSGQSAQTPANTSKASHKALKIYGIHQDTQGTQSMAFIASTKSYNWNVT